MSKKFEPGPIQIGGSLESRDYIPESERPVPPAKKERKVSKMDSELQAMARIDRMLADFDEAAQQRIIGWINSRKADSTGKRLMAACQGDRPNADS